MTLNIQPPHARSQAEVIEGLNELRRMVIESPTNIELLKRIDDSDWIMPIDAIDLVELADETLAARRMKGEWLNMINHKMKIEVAVHD